MKGDVFKGEKMIILSPKVLGKYTNHPLVKRLYLTDVGFFPNAQGHYRKRKTGIDEYILIYCTAGSGRIHLRDQQYTLQPHEAFCIPASQVHWYEALEENPWSILWVHFRGEDTQYFPVDNCKVVKFLSTTSTNHMIFLFELLFHALSGEYSIQKFIYTSQVLSLILGETYLSEIDDVSKSKDRAMVKTITKYMERFLHVNLTLSEISAEFGLSTSYLNQMFQKYTQHAPIDFYINLKIEEACKLLKSTDCYVYEIAQSLGYKDQYYFSRLFKERVGVSPKKYREHSYVKL